MKPNLTNIPAKPGIYKFKDSQRKLLYIGKAKNLNSRVKSYFTDSADLSPAKKLMVEKITKIEYTIVTNEIEALLLESTLIKKHQPPFNIDLKDDKSWLYIKITDDELPQVIAVRQIKERRSRNEGRRFMNYEQKNNHRSPASPELQRGESFINHNLPTYFGPYTSASSVRQTMRLLRKIFPYFSEKGPMIELGKKAGSPYHLGRYLNQKIIDRKEWQKIIKQIINFFSGRTDKLQKDLTLAMHKASLKQNYEKAGQLRDQLSALAKISQCQQVISLKKTNEDYHNLFAQENLAVVTLFKIREGRLIDQQNFTLKNIRPFSRAEILSQFIGRYYAQTADRPKILVVPEKIAYDSIKSVCPQKGGKKKLLDLAHINAKHYFGAITASWEKRDNELKEALLGLKKIFKLSVLPDRIEAYDISNIQGVSATGSMVVFTNGLPDKNEYRRFAIKTVKGINDPAMIGEIIKRRLRHADWPKPDLMLIDGGPTQLKTAGRYAKNLPIISLAKQEEKIYLPDQIKPLKLSKKSPELQLLQRIRDEAHRFAINYHRKLRDKDLFN